MKVIANWNPKTHPLIKSGKIDEELITKLIKNFIPKYPLINKHIEAYIFSLGFLTKEYILKWDINDLMYDFNKIKCGKVDIIYNL